jgi:hypothetical protein
VEQEIAKKVDAHVYFNDFGVSLFSHFPNLTASLDNFGVVGKGVFRGDTLAAAESFKVSVNLMSVIRAKRSGESPRPGEPPHPGEGAQERQGQLRHLHPDTTTTADAADTTQSQFALQVDQWSIRNGLRGVRRPEHAHVRPAREPQPLRHRRLHAGHFRPGYENLH